MASNPSNWLPELIGPVNIYDDGTQVERRRGGINFVNATITDNPAEDRLDIDVGAAGAGVTPTGTGFTRVTGGVQDAAASAVNLAGGATHVAGVLPVDNGGTGYNEADLATEADKAVVVNATGDGYDFADVVDIPALAGNGGKAVAVDAGATALEYVACTGTGSFARATSPTLVTPVIKEIEHTTSHAVSINGDGVVQYAATGMVTGVPRLGVPGSGTYDGVSFAAGSAFSSEGYLQLNIFNAGGTHVTIDGGTYSRTCIDFRSASGARSVYFPLPGSGDAAYAKDLINESGHTVTVCVNDAQPSALATVTLADGASGRFWFTADGVFGPIAPAAGGGGGSPGGNANEIQTNDGAGGFAGATNVKAGSGFLSIGAGTVHASALIRLPYVATDVVIGAPNSGGTDYPVLHRTSANTWRFGDATGWNTAVYGDIVTFYGASGTTMYAPGGSVVAIELAASANIKLFDGAGVGGGSKVLSVANATTAPTSNPTGGALWYVEGGASKARGSSGTITTFGPADPHCPTCGRDFATEHRNDDMGEHFAVCLPCLIDAVVALGADASKFAMVDKRGASKAAWDDNHAKAKARNEAAETARAEVERGRRMALAQAAAFEAIARDARKGKGE
jgi:hypothetical protein